MGLRPGKLRKKGLGEDNKDSALTRGIAVQILMPERLILMSGGLLVALRGLLVALREFMG